MTLHDLGKRVGAWRRNKNISQSELCNAAGISRATLSQLENGELAELGYTKVQRLLSCLDWVLTPRQRPPMPTLSELIRTNTEENEGAASAPGGP